MLGAVLLHEARTRAGLTQTELGRRVGVPANVISRWERGEVAVGLERLDELVRGCGLQLDVALRTADNSQRTLIEGYRGMTPGERLDGLHRRVTLVAQLQSRDETEQFDPRALLRALTDAGVSYLVIGGVAATLHGAPHPTYDLDIVPVPGARNAARLTRALAALNAVAVPADPGLERFETRHGVLQVVRRPAGTGGFADLRRDAETMSLADGHAVSVASLADIVRSKDALGRGDERAAVGTLRQFVAQAA